MKKRKLILVTLGTLAGSAVLICLILYCTIRHIVKRLDCELFNIDNVELRTQTNIPDLTGIPICRYDEGMKVKTNLFILAPGVDMSDYLQKNKFKQVAGNIPRFTYQPDWNTHLSKHNFGRDLYSKSGTYIGEESGNQDTWLYLLDTSTRELRLELIRTKHH